MRPTRNRSTMRLFKWKYDDQADARQSTRSRTRRAINALHCSSDGAATRSSGGSPSTRGQRRATAGGSTA